MMSDEDFWRVLVIGRSLRMAKGSHTTKYMYMIANQRGMSKRNARRYMRIHKRFSDWVNPPAGSIKAMDILASCPLVSDKDIRRRNRVLGRKMDSTEARALVHHKMLEDEPILSFVLPRNHRLKTSWIKSARKMLKDDPERFIKRASYDIKFRELVNR